MPPPDTSEPLTSRERYQVVAVAAALLALFAFLGAHASLLGLVQDAWHAGRPLTAVALCLGLVGYVGVLPVLIVSALVVLVQGLLRKRTRLTRWVLEGLSK